MERREFSTLYTARLAIDYVYGLTNSTADLGNSAKTNLDVVSIATLTQLNTDKDALAAAIKKATASVITTQLTEANKSRSEVFAEIKRTITFNVKSSNSQKKEAAQNVKNFFNAYWDINEKAIEAQTTLFADLVTKYKEKSTLKEQAAIIGVDTLMTTLETTNTNFGTLYKNRTTEKAQNAGVSASSLKPQILWSYERFCTSVELAATFTPSDALTLLFNEMDALRKKYSVLVSQTEEEADNGNTNTGTTTNDDTTK